MPHETLLVFQRQFWDEIESRNPRRKQAFDTGLDFRRETGGGDGVEAEFGFDQVRNDGVDVWQGFLQLHEIDGTWKWGKVDTGRGG